MQPKTPGQNVKIVADAFPVPESVVAQHDRRLAEKGYRTKGGRGAQAPQIGLEDAAKLVIAVLAAEPYANIYANTYEAVKSIWEAESYRDGTPFIRIDANRIPDFTSEIAGRKLLGSDSFIKQKINPFLTSFTAARKSGATFGPCLTALIDDCVNRRVGDYLGPNRAEWESKFQVKIVQPNNHCVIGFGDGSGLYVEYEFYGLRDMNAGRDVITTQEMTINPLLRIAKAFRE